MNIVLFSCLKLWWLFAIVSLFGYAAHLYDQDVRS